MQQIAKHSMIPVRFDRTLSHRQLIQFFHYSFLLFVDQLRTKNNFLFLDSLFRFQDTHGK